MVNPWLILGALLAVLGIGAGCYAYGNHIGAQGVQIAWDKDRLAQAKTLSDAKDRAAAQLKTAQKAAEAAVARADDNAKTISNRNADLQRRIAGLQRAEAVHCPGLLAPDHRPAAPPTAAADTVVVSRSVVETAADCARDYATVAGELLEIRELAR